MKLNVNSLINAIDVLIQKEDDELRDSLEEAGFVSPDEAVEHINTLDDLLSEAFGNNADNLLVQLGESESVGKFIKDVLPQFFEVATLETILHDILFKQFDSMIRQFTRNWLLKEAPDLAVDERITKPTQDFIKSWSSDLANLMKLNTNEQIEKVLLNASKKHLSVADTATLIGDSGIRQYGYRSRRVAVTEVLRSESYSQLEYMRQDPSVVRKRWHHTGSHKNKPRQNHVDMDGQEVGYDEAFELIGADGDTYYPECPRDVCLPARETVNCHCLMNAVKDKSVFGMTEEERRELRRQAMDAVDAKWAEGEENEEN